MRTIQYHRAPGRWDHVSQSVHVRSSVDRGRVWVAVAMHGCRTEGTKAKTTLETHGLVAGPMVLLLVA